MSTITWPYELSGAAFDCGIEYDVQFDVSRSGQIDSYGLPGSRWLGTLTVAEGSERKNRPLIEAIIVSLRGGARTLSMHHLGRPVPNGTLRGSPTVATQTARGDNTVALANCNGTLRAGDFGGLGSEWYMVEEDAEPTAGAMTVKVSPAVRSIHTVGTAWVWNRPRLLWIPKSNVAGPFPYIPGRIRPGFAIELVERG